MFIFPDAFSEEQLDGAVDNIKGEVEKVGGVVESAIRLGRRTFAREMDKTRAGQYVVLTFALSGSQVEALKSNLRFNEEIFRMQIFRVEDKKADEAVVPAAKE
jgi:ribosomal protein S6